MSKTARITKSIRLDKELDKKINLFCNLEDTTQADYINNILYEDLSARTLERKELKEQIILNIPLTEDKIKECFINKTDLREFKDDENDVLIISVNLNNYLDKWHYGTYKGLFSDKHSGLILIKDDFTHKEFFVYLEYEIKNQFKKDCKDYVLYSDKDNEDIQEIIQEKELERNHKEVTQVYLISYERAIQYSKLAENTELYNSIILFTGKSLDDDQESYKIINDIVPKENSQSIFKSTLAEKSKELNDLKREVKELKIINETLVQSLEDTTSERNILKLKNETLEANIDNMIKEALISAKKEAMAESQEMFNSILKDYGLKD